ncbi:MAG: hypothetical protein HKN49_11175 [Gammaproteobacteria bacterium]|nr:hypothetical protein [Gammaproteobacteria bacterium]
MKYKIIATLLVSVGSLQMIGDLAGIDWLKGLGAATGASPAPKVFTAHNGFETFSSEFYFEYDDNGTLRRERMTAARYRGLRGPYNRRNAYGAALAYGPLLQTGEHTAAMFASVSDYAFCDPATARHELDIGPGKVRVVLQPRAAVPDELPLSFEVNCDD